ncbi:FxsA family protein [Streptomyces sp. XM4193]|uniref:FxsA family membrane protein n=1 Tax=Streptomyces sp. XM4193 TaxID=2929782 RepID=UPI001FFBB820|nr:FxsA family membrane protein [Streptomyces sp. XM4193]MCK1798926.1 FxsA family protein [Streptomyces sp. XM4193]
MTTGDPTPYERPREQSDTPRAPRGASSGANPRPRGVRRFLPLLVAAWAVLEVWLLIQLAGPIGLFGVVLVLAAGFVLGAVVIKRAGRRAWHNLAETLQPGSTGAAADGENRRKGGGNGLAMLGGLLLMLPGLASDALGLLCIFPPTAALIRRAAGRSFGGGGLADAVQQARSAQEQVRIHRPDGKVVPGEVIREDEPGGKPEDGDGPAAHGPTRP